MIYNPDSLLFWSFLSRERARLREEVLDRLTEIKMAEFYKLAASITPWEAAILRAQEASWWPEE
jgi:hypothetical protein